MTPPFAAKPLGSGFSLFRALFRAHRYRSARNTPSSVTLFAKRKGHEQGSRKSQRSEIFGKRRSGVRTRALPLCDNASADCSDEGALAKSVIFARAVRLLKSITSLVILSGAKRSNRRQKSRRFRQQVAMGIRPYAADCGALVLPLASKVKLRAPSKDLYGNNDDIRIEIPRRARDNRELFSGARYLIMEKYDFAVCNLGAAVTLLREVIF